MAQGCRNRQELAQVKQGLREANTEIISITPRICSCASNLIDDYALSDGLRLADALIAATAIEMNLTLLTANINLYSSVVEEHHGVSTGYAAFVGASLFAHNRLFGRMNSPLPLRQLRF